MGGPRIEGNSKKDLQILHNVNGVTHGEKGKIRRGEFSLD